jgi:hypothetical protein
MVTVSRRSPWRVSSAGIRLRRTDRDSSPYPTPPRSRQQISPRRDRSGRLQSVIRPSEVVSTPAASRPAGSNWPNSGPPGAPCNSGRCVTSPLRGTSLEAIVASHQSAFCPSTIAVLARAVSETESWPQVAADLALIHGSVVKVGVSLFVSLPEGIPGNSGRPLGSLNAKFRPGNPR